MRVITRRRLGVMAGTGMCAVLLVGCGSSGTSTGNAGSHSSAGSGHGASSSPSSAAGGGTEEGKPAQKVLADAKSALFNAKAVHITGKVGATAGQDADLDMQFQGQDAEGTIALGSIKVRIVKTDGQVFIEAPAAFWSKTLGSKGAALSGKWIKVDARDAGGLGSFSLQGIAASLDASGAPLDPKTATATVDGRRAVVITQKDGSKLYVADSDNPVPLQIVSGSGDKTKRTVHFRDYGSTRQIHAPARALTLQQAIKAGGVSKT